MTAVNSSSPDKLIQARPVPVGNEESLSMLSPLLRRIYMSRGIRLEAELDRRLTRLPDPWQLSGMEAMVQSLATAIEKDKNVLVVGDFDADGATSCAVAVRGLSLLGLSRIGYLVPNRFEFGYGLTPELVELAAKQNPAIILTVDSGITCLEGVRCARERGIEVLVTDHHLPGEELPVAHAIVNPNQPGDDFPSKSLAGVGVMFYVLMALRTRLRETGYFARQGMEQPNLAGLLDLVALGTVADVVPLDHINRVLVHQGLQRIRRGQAQPGVLALLEIADRKPASITAADLGFAVGPRLNAAGRLDDMSLGIECLLCAGRDEAAAMAARLDSLNRERRKIEEQMKAEALTLLDRRKAMNAAQLPLGVCLLDHGWHQGVIGILASRLKERLDRPVIAFAPAGEGLIKGSARSIPGIHIRDVLCEVAACRPGLLARFGGHAMAAGLSLREADFPVFAPLFDEVVRRHCEGLNLGQTIYSDGRLEDEQFDLEFAELLRSAGPWGQGFPEPLFDGVFEVLGVRIVGGSHLKFALRQEAGRRAIDAIAFFPDEPESWLGCGRVRIAYRLDVNEYRDQRSPQLVIEHLLAMP